MTPQELDDALELARYYVQKPSGAKSNAAMLARALLALTEQLAEANRLINTKLHLSDLTEQPEPVSEGTLTTFLYDTALANLLDIDGDTPCVLAVELRRNYVITPKPETKDQADSEPDDPAHVDGALDRIAGHALAGAYLDQNGGAV